MLFQTLRTAQNTHFHEKLARHARGLEGQNTLNLNQVFLNWVNKNPLPKSVLVKGGRVLRASTDLENRYGNGSWYGKPWFRITESH